MSTIVREIELKRIHLSKLNPRLEMNVARLGELASSIKEVGLLQPIIVRPVDPDYEVVLGERRYRASQQAGLTKIPTIVRDYTDDEVVQLNLVENIQREELSAIEKGQVCKYLLENCADKYPSQSSIAKKIGVSAEAVSLWLNAVEVIPKEAQQYIAPSGLSGEVPEGKIDYSTAVKIGRSVEEPKRQVELIKKLAEKKLPKKDRTQVIEKISTQPEKSVEQAIKEVEETPYEMRFEAVDKEPLVRGIKTQTSITDMPNQKIKAGLIVRAVVWEPHIADLRITSIERKKLRYFNDEDAKREGGYTLEQFRKIWKKTHAEWDEDQLVYVIHFEKLKNSLRSPTIC